MIYRDMTKIYRGTSSSEMCECKICGDLVHQMELISHARRHRIVLGKKRIYIYDENNALGLPLGWNEIDDIGWGNPQ